MILRHMRLVAPRLARCRCRQLSVRTLDTPFISDSIPVRTVRVGVSALPSDLPPQGSHSTGSRSTPPATR